MAEETVRRGVENLKISCDSPATRAAAPRSPSTHSSSRGSPSSRHGESSPNLQPQEGRVLKTHPSPKVRKVKMRSRQHRAAEQRQRLLELRAFKGPTKIYRADESNFRELVYQHTCQIGAHIPSTGAAGEPDSPPTPQSSISATSWSLVSSPRSPFSLISSDGSSSSSWDFVSPLSSPIPSRSSGSSNSTSPVSSPRRDL